MPSSSWSSSASSEFTTEASGVNSRAAAAISGEGSKIATVSTDPVSTTAFIRWKPILPTPRKPTRGRMMAFGLVESCIASLMADHQRFDETFRPVARNVERGAEFFEREPMGVEPRGENRPAAVASIASFMPRM